MKPLVSLESQVSKGRLTYGEAMASPCASCATSPCCTYLPLHTFKVTNTLELDHAVYLLNFDRIELGLSASGEWSVYYRYPCRFLDRQDFSCTVHNTPQQPNICVNYNPYACWYKRVLTRDVSDEFLRIDLRRMEFILERVVFDESRNIIEVPAWETLVEGFADLPLQPIGEFGEPPEAGDTLAEARQRVVFNGGNAHHTNSETYSYTDESLRNPCSGCQAYCCKTLVFPKAVPTSKSGLDYLQFCLGFPGVELGISDSGWSIVVKTTCRHLKNNLCSVYGKTERPLICRYYDAWTCSYKLQFGVPRPAGFLRVALGEFRWLAESFQFDEHGSVLEYPQTEMIRQHIEEQRQQSSAKAIAAPALARPVSSGA